MGISVAFGFGLIGAGGRVGDVDYVLDEVGGMSEGLGGEEAGEGSFA